MAKTGKKWDHYFEFNFARIVFCIPSPCLLVSFMSNLSSMQSKRFQNFVGLPRFLTRNFAFIIPALSSLFCQPQNLELFPRKAEPISIKIQNKLTYKFLEISVQTLGGCRKYPSERLSCAYSPTSNRNIQSKLKMFRALFTEGQFLQLFVCYWKQTDLDYGSLVYQDHWDFV